MSQSIVLDQIMTGSSLRHHHEKNDPAKDPNRRESSVEISSNFSFKTTSTFTTQQEDDSTLFERSHTSLTEGGGVAALATAQTKRDTQRISEQLSSINRISFGDLGLYGRDEEIRILEEHLAPQQEPKKQVIFLSGLAGTGKTSLAFSVRRTVQRRQGMFCSGKFDLQLREVPYSGIAQACNDICVQILSLSEDEPRESSSQCSDDLGGNGLLEQVRSDLTKGLRDNQRNLLTRLVPTLQDIIFDNDIEPDAQVEGAEISFVNFEQGTEQSLNELNYAFQSFLGLISTRFSSLVMVLDDLQWADAASLSLVETLLTGREEKNMIIVGLYRSDEVPTTHPLHLSIREIKDLSSKHRFSMTEISIGNLSVRNVQSILKELLSLGDHQKSLELAELCHKRTEGNPFFLLYFVRILEEKEVLKFNLGSFNWTWDLSKVQQIGATENIIGLLKDKMLSFPSNIQKFLVVTACLGSSFEVTLLQLVWNEICKEESLDEEGTNYLNFLDICVKEGYFERQKTSTLYQWVHDKLQEAALGIVDPASLSSLKQNLGNILKSWLSDSKRNENLFLIVTLLNEGTPSSGFQRDDGQALELAELNLRASQKASSLSAFSSATKYAVAGIRLLPDSPWMTEKKLTLSLYQSAAEAESCLGRMESMKTFTGEMIGRGELSLLDKLGAYNLESHQMHHNGNVRGAHDMIIDLLGKLGMKFPKNPLSVGASTIRAVFGIKNSIAKLDRDTIMTFPLMTDKTQLKIMKLLERLCLTTYHLKGDLLPFVVWKSIHTTMKYGMSKNSVNGFLFGGVIVGAAFGDFSGIAKLGDALLKYFDQPLIIDRRPRVLFAAHTFWLPWTRPLRAMVKELMSSYQKGLEAGDTEAATWCVYQYILYAYISGKPLGVLRDDCLTYIPQAFDLRLDTIAAFQRVCFDAILKCIGEGEESSPHVNFDRASISEMTSTSTSFGSDSPLELLLYGVLKLQIHVIFNEFDTAGDLAVIQGETFSKESPGNPLSMMTTFYSSFALFGKASLFACSKSNARKLVKLAKKKHLIIKDWVKKENPNVVHSDACLDAEYARYNGRLADAGKYYQKAITLAARGGFLQDAGLISERYSSFLSDTCDPPQEKDALFHLDRAIEFYRNWGSTKKVKMLMEARMYQEATSY